MSISEPAATTDHHVTIRPPSGWAALHLGEVWLFRDLLFTLAGRDLRLRYKQTALGMIWVVLQPMLAAGVFSFVFGTVAGLKAPGAIPYFVFSYVGLQGWNLFSGTLSRSGASLVGNSHLISKVYFPRLVLPLSTLPSTMVDFGVSAAMLVAMLAWYGLAPGWGLVLLPIWIVMLLALALGIGLITAAFSVKYRDVLFILPVFIQILLYASPVAYGVDRVPEHLRRWYYLNPLTAPLEASRWSILGVGSPPAPELAYSAGVTLVLLLAGAFSFKRMERQFADVI
jgi:lipopolysaccharide transport system permease protein